MNQIKVELQDVMGNDRSIADAAWTSSFDYNKKKTRSEADVARVVAMLADNKHSTPFESVVLRFWIKMPIATDRQFMTHRLQSSSGMSGRYRTMPSEYLETPEDVFEILEKQNIMDIGNDYTYYCEATNIAYNNWLKRLKQKEVDGDISNSEYKRCREFLRGVLPQHNMTERVSIMNLRAWCNFIKLRNTEHAQPEIREVARLMLEQVKEKNVAPIALAALEKNGWVI